MSIPNLTPGAGAAAKHTMAVKLTEALAATHPSAGAATVAKTAGDLSTGSVIKTSVGGAATKAIPLDVHGHVIPPAGAETLFGALGHLPNDAANWFGSHDLLGGLTDWFHHLDLTGPLLSMTQLVTGIAPWLTVALLGIRLIDLGGNMIQRHRAPVNLVHYRIPTPTVPPVMAYLQSAQVEVRDTIEDGDHTRIGVPAWHSGPADRAFAHLHKQAGLSFTKI